jgi:hypothetical protein
MIPGLEIFALDVGVPDRPSPAARSSSLGWAGPGQSAMSLTGLANALAGCLAAPTPVHLYIEAPLFLPTDPANPASSAPDLCAMRPFEHCNGSPQAWMVGNAPWPKSKGNRNLAWTWTGNAGGATLSMGLQELAWLLACLNVAAQNGGAVLQVDSCPQTAPRIEEEDDGACSSGNGEPASAQALWRLTVLEAFHPRGSYSRTGSHNFQPLTSPNHVQVAERIRDVADHFKGIPCLSPTCGCGSPVGGQVGVWFDSAGFPPGKGTFNLVALACWAAGVAGPARNAHGWVLCA